MRSFLPIVLAAGFVLMGHKCGKPPKPMEAALDAVEQALDEVDVQAALEERGSTEVVVSVALDDDMVPALVRFDAHDGASRAVVDVAGEAFVFSLPLEDVALDDQ